MLAALARAPKATAAALAYARKAVGVGGASTITTAITLGWGPHHSLDVNTWGWAAAVGFGLATLTYNLTNGPGKTPA